MKNNAAAVRATFLGGLGDVGRNCTLLQCGSDALLIDCGVLFPDERAPGVDIILPDFDLLADLKGKLHGVVFTHGHEDHIGAAPYLLREYDLPLYGSPLTLAFLTERLRQHGMAGKADLRQLRERTPVRLGCFEVTPYHVSHSIPDAMGLAIDTPAGMIIHTGDYMIDSQPFDGQPTDLQLLGTLGAEGVLALLADSTNADTPGHTKSQQSVYEGLERIFAQAEYGRVIIANFSSNLIRVQQIADLAAQFGRQVCLLGRSLERNLPLATDLALLDIDPSEILETRLVDQVPHEELAIVCTGSQGEPGSALQRLADGRHQLLEIDPGDTVVLAASTIPGNERSVQRMIGKLFRRGANVIFGDLGDVHVSGHPAREDTRTMLSVVRPKFFVPVHGAHHHLALQGRLAIDSGLSPDRVAVAMDGDVLEISPDSITLKEHRACAYRYVTRSAATGYTTSEGTLGRRRRLAQGGVVAAHAQVDLRAGRLVGPVVLEAVGLCDEESATVAKLAKRLPELWRRERNESIDIHDAQAKLKILVGRQLKAETGLRPTIVPLVTAA